MHSLGAAYVAAAVQSRRKKMDRIVQRIQKIVENIEETKQEGKQQPLVLLEIKDNAIEAVIRAHRRSNVLLCDLLEDKSYSGTCVSHIRANQSNHKRPDVVALRLALLLQKIDRARLNAVEQQEDITRLINHDDSNGSLTRSLLENGLVPFPMHMSTWLSTDTLERLLQQGFSMRSSAITTWCPKVAMNVDVPPLWCAIHSLEKVQFVAAQLRHRNIDLETQYTTFPSVSASLYGCTVLHWIGCVPQQSDTEMVKVIKWLFTLRVPPDVHARRMSTQTTAIQEMFIYGDMNGRLWQCVGALIEAGADLFESWPIFESPLHHPCAFVRSHAVHSPVADHVQLVLEHLKTTPITTTKHESSLLIESMTTVRHACQKVTRTICMFIDNELGTKETIHPLMRVRPLVKLIVAYNYI